MNIPYLAVASNILPAIILLIFPIVTLVQVWQSSSRKRPKIIWALFIVITWLAFAFGSFVYAFIKYKGYKKLIPAVLILIFVMFFWGLRGNLEKMVDLTNDVSATHLQTAIQKGGFEEKLKEKFLSDIEVIKNDFATNNEAQAAKGQDTQSSKQTMLLSYISFIISDKVITKEEEKTWYLIMNKRHTLDAAALHTLITTKLLSSKKDNKYKQ